MNMQYVENSKKRKLRDIKHEKAWKDVLEHVPTKKRKLNNQEAIRINEAEVIIFIISFTI